MSVAAFKAIVSRAELEAKALKSLASSETKDFPAFPWALKRFGLQCTASVNAALREFIKVKLPSFPQVKHGVCRGDELREYRIASQGCNSVLPQFIQECEGDSGRLDERLADWDGVVFGTMGGCTGMSFGAVGKGTTWTRLAQFPSRCGRQFWHAWPLLTHTVQTVSCTVAFAARHSSVWLSVSSLVSMIPQF